MGFLTLQAMLVVGPGQREGLLLQFDSPGKYRVMPYLINDAWNLYNQTSVSEIKHTVNASSSSE
jgi:hypothetical protein